MSKKEYLELIAKMAKAIEDVKNEYELELFRKDRQIAELKKAIEEAETAKTQEE